jgi:hypothetical protein
LESAPETGRFDGGAPDPDMPPVPFASQRVRPILAVERVSDKRAMRPRALDRCGQAAEESPLSSYDGKGG